jgi:segregation and condensation protein B
MSLQKAELKNLIEAALLAAGEPLTIERLLAMFPDESRPSRQAVSDALKELERDYEGRGIELKRIDRGYRVQTRERYAEWLGRLSQERPPRYSRALLETLAIIAYRQPVTRGDIESIRGVSVSSEIVHALLEREWIRQVGHRDTPGKPALYGTTRQFNEYFNLASLDELPPLADLRDLDEIGRQLDLRLAAGYTAAAGPDEGAAGATPDAPTRPAAEDVSHPHRRFGHAPAAPSAAETYPVTHNKASGDE